MSIPPINPFAGMAAHQPSDDQRQIHNERERKQDQAKLQTESETDAEAAATTAAGDREGDGKQAYHVEEPTDADNQTNEDVESTHRSRSIDPNCGSHLDLDG